jgi:hypothetical protein
MSEINNYNPDVLTCLANLSNDEVFTSPQLANKILDLLPANIWQSKTVTFLDPGTKSGVFLREITRRLNKGLEDEIPDLQERINHILNDQVFGMSITELTGLLSRRSLYCSKAANGKYSLSTNLVNPDGNIRSNPGGHSWTNGKCTFCGASEAEYDRGESLEAHAYEFIHTNKPEKIFNMKFDVIIGNPPYQLSTGGSGAQAKPMYHLFIQQAMKLNPRFLAMIVPSRWFAGGMGLDAFRESMLHDKRISHMVDFTNAKDCFAGISLSGGVNYFLWQREYSGPCEFTSVHDNQSNTKIRFLDEFSVLVRHNEAVDIIHKVRTKNEPNITSIVSSINPFGFGTASRGESTKFKNSITLNHSKGVGYIATSEITQGKDLLKKYKVMVSQTTSEHAGEPAKDGKFKLLATVKVLGPNEICTFSYITIGSFDTEIEAKNLKKYLETKFARFLVLQAISSIHLSKDKFVFLPIQDFTKIWDDKALNKKYNLMPEEIDYIDSMMKPIDSRDDE